MNLDSIALKTYEHGFAIYQESVILRTRILLETIGRPEKASEFDFPEKDIYLGAFLGERLVATLILTPVDNEKIQMRQLAVNENFRNIGIGRTLVKKSEMISLERGFKYLILHARESVLDFYDRLGYKRCGERFIEVNLPHWKMEKSLIRL
ncbi:MAG: GNAT family N-acetyltransferase [Candidatus Marinimicrobia bacterium]|nr:GNAT family N-acetyltransferase [Candidatus Neomarinimicrobiota bacterium]